MTTDSGSSRILFITNQPTPENTFAIVRLTFHDESEIQVREVALLYDGLPIEDLMPRFTRIIKDAIWDGADVCIMTEHEMMMFDFES